MEDPVPLLVDDCFTSLTWKDMVSKVRDYYKVQNVNSQGPFGQDNDGPSAPKSMAHMSIQSQIIRQLLGFLEECFLSGQYSHAKDIIQVLCPIYNLVGSQLWPCIVRLFRLIPSYQPLAVRFMQELSVKDRKNRVSICTELIVYWIIHDHLPDAYEFASSCLTKIEFEHATTMRGLAGLLGWFFIQDRKSKSPRFPNALKTHSTNIIFDRVKSNWNAYFYLHSTGKSDELYHIIASYANDIGSSYLEYQDIVG
jgi:hypothetical protein